jgi:hypothetical protein
MRLQASFTLDFAFSATIKEGDRSFVLDNANWILLPLSHNCSAGLLEYVIRITEPTTPLQKSMGLALFDFRHVDRGGLVSADDFVKRDRPLKNFCNRVFDLDVRIERKMENHHLILDATVEVKPIFVSLPGRSPLRWLANGMCNRVPALPVAGVLDAQTPISLQTLIEATTHPPPASTEEEFVKWGEETSMETAQLMATLGRWDTLPELKVPTFSAWRDNVEGRKGIVFDLLSRTFVSRMTARRLCGEGVKRIVCVSALTIEQKARALVAHLSSPSLDGEIMPSVVVCDEARHYTWLAALRRAVEGLADTRVVSVFKSARVLGNSLGELCWSRLNISPGHTVIVLTTYRYCAAQVDWNESDVLSCFFMHNPIKSPWACAVLDDAQTYNLDRWFWFLSITSRFTLAHGNFFEPTSVYSAMRLAMAPLVDFPHITNFKQSKHKHPLFHQISVLVHRDIVHAPSLAFRQLHPRLLPAGLTLLKGVNAKKAAKLLGQVADDTYWMRRSLLTVNSVIKVPVGRCTGDEGDEGGVGCPICLEDPGAMVRSVSCGHAVCDQCWKEDFKRKSCCICRQKPLKGHVLELEDGAKSDLKCRAATSAKFDTLTKFIAQKKTRGDASVAVLCLATTTKARVRDLLIAQNLPTTYLVTPRQLQEDMVTRPYDCVVLYDNDVPLLHQWAAHIESFAPGVELVHLRCGMPKPRTVTVLRRSKRKRTSSSSATTPASSSST